MRYPAPSTFASLASLTALTALTSLVALTACTPAAPPSESSASASAAAVIEDWRREALERRKHFTADGPDRMFGYAGKIEDLLDKPDPPAAPGPLLRVTPPAADSLAWPAPREGVLHVRYRIERKSCGGYGASEGCHLLALCPVEGQPGLATVINASPLDPQPLAEVRVEVLEVPSPRCELRLSTRDIHASALCTARGPALPASFSGAAVLDIGTVGLDGDSCKVDKLAERMTLRAELAAAWKRRGPQKAP